MPRIVATHAVKDVKHWASQGDKRVEDLTPFGTDLVDYVAADGSNRVAVSVNIHDMVGSDGLHAITRDGGNDGGTRSHTASHPPHGVAASRVVEKNSVSDLAPIPFK